MKVKEVAKALKRLKLNVGEMHSDLEQNQREAIMINSGTDASICW